ncbi:uncharacterized protein EI90DRAFT_3011150 [Cantharellus anzutake]|uniref:uncharacterized protein n=1 Tax=Cantharellus anzutake TaxID=1750568 RepID=UPI0019037097|nr:uncharacterized protein EI90DRAFT_3011150 [Cantharellus anzutake]KAF8342633.1 hypothetical protein EI90DRAFT_3011150 [Cantharellus anzutake]
MACILPNGSINPSGEIKGGFGFYVGEPEGATFSWEDAKEVLVSYAVYFEPGFKFQLGGKLPGPYGGSTPEQAFKCTGGRKERRDECFSLRLMWRQNGTAEVYGYLPSDNQTTQILSKVPPLSVLNPKYGFSIGRGSWAFVPGQWTTVAIRVRLNAIESRDGTHIETKYEGEIEVFANGASALKAVGL